MALLLAQLPPIAFDMSQLPIYYPRTLEHIRHTSSADVFAMASSDDCELLRRTITGRFFFNPAETTCPCPFLLPEKLDFLSCLVGSGEGGSTTTCEFGLSGAGGDLWGETKRAVGRGPLDPLFLPFELLRIGGGIVTGVLGVDDAGSCLECWTSIALELPWRTFLL